MITGHKGFSSPFVNDQPVRKAIIQHAMDGLENLGNWKKLQNITSHRSRKWN